MIVRSSLKCPLLALLITTATGLAFSIAIVVYQAVSKYIGFNWSSNITVTQCSSNYLVQKLSLQDRIVTNSFIGAIVSCVFGAAALVMIAMSVHSFRKRGVELENLAAEVDPMRTAEKKNMEALLFEELDQFFTFRKLVALYILLSLAILGGVVHCGSIIGLTVSLKSCKGGGFLLVLMILSLLSIISLLCQIAAWIILQTLRCKFHTFMEQNQQIPAKLNITKSRQNLNPKAEQMHTMYPLNTHHAEDNQQPPLMEQFRQDPNNNQNNIVGNEEDDNTRKPFVYSNHAEAEVAHNKPASRNLAHPNEHQPRNLVYSKEEIKEKNVTPTFADQREENSQNHLLVPKGNKGYASKQSENSNPRGSQKRDDLSDVRNPYAQQSRYNTKQLSGSRHRDYMSYMKEQNSATKNGNNKGENISPFKIDNNSPIKEDNKNSSEHPYFVSPKKQGRENIFDDRSEESPPYNYGRSKPESPSPSPDTRDKFKNPYYNNKANEKSPNSKVLEQERKNYLEQNNYSSILRKDSMHEREPTKNPTLLYEVKAIDHGAKPQKKRKGMLIDYIRSKYAD